VGTEHLTVNRQGAFRLRSDGVDIEPPLPVCPFPIEPGREWHAEYRFGERKAVVVYRGEKEEVVVPAGTFQSYAVKCEAISRGMTTRSTVWHAPKVGMVKQVIEEGDRSITLTLERFERAIDQEPVPKFIKKNPK
jgi:hypothetical protein